MNNRTYFERRLYRVIETIDKAIVQGAVAKKIILNLRADGCGDLDSAFDTLDKFACFVIGSFRYSEVKWLVPPETDYVLFNAVMKLELSCVP